MNNQNHAFWENSSTTGSHFLQVYNSEDILLESLEAYINSGLANGDGIVLLATEEHLQILKKRIEKNYNVNKLLSSRQYIAIDADMVLSKIMDNGKVNELLFTKVIQEILRDVNKQPGSMTRIFGEFVAILWREGNIKEAVKLEKLWDALCGSGSLKLFCAYPETILQNSELTPIKHICAHHDILIKNNSFVSELDIHGKKIPLIPAE
jgi:hypothetical protein